MKRRKWLSKDKFKIVLEGLSGNIEISKLCSKYQVSQTQYYQWRDLLLKFGNQAFEQKNVSKKEQKLKSEVTEQPVSPAFQGGEEWPPGAKPGGETG